MIFILIMLILEATARETSSSFKSDVRSLTENSKNTTTRQRMMGQEYDIKGITTTAVLDFKFFPVTCRSVQIMLKTAADACVMLSPINNVTKPRVEIFFGIWSNTMTAIYKNRHIGEWYDYRAEAQTPYILDPLKYREFWVRWDFRGRISAGRVGQPALVEWQDPEPFAIKYVGFGSYDFYGGSPGHWELKALTEICFSTFVSKLLNHVSTMYKADATYLFSAVEDHTEKMFIDGTLNDLGTEMMMHVRHAAGLLTRYPINKIQAEAIVKLYAIQTGDMNDDIKVLILQIDDDYLPQERRELTLTLQVLLSYPDNKLPAEHIVNAVSNTVLAPYYRQKGSLHTTDLVRQMVGAINKRESEIAETLFG